MEVKVSREGRGEAQIKQNPVELCQDWRKNLSSVDGKDENFKQCVVER